MNRRDLGSSPVQQLMAAGNPNWWSVKGGMRPPPPLMGHHQPSPFLQSPPPPLPNLLPQLLSSPDSSSSSSSWLDNQRLPPESWSISQLLLGGLMGEENKLDIAHDDFQGKTMENWEEQAMNHEATMSVACGAVDVMQENCCHVFDFSSNNINNKNKFDGRHPPPNRSSECNGSETGGSAKKARVQPSAASTQSTLKEKLGGRISALHQLVSPFGKTDTASVLSEAIGYIRFLQSQIEALSSPYFGNASGNMRQQPQHAQGEKNCIYAEDSGLLLNEICVKRNGGSADDRNPNEEPNKDLRSRGLCLVPISCTLQVGRDNGADYWAPAPRR